MKDTQVPKMSREIKRISFVEGYTPTTVEQTLNEVVDMVNVLSRHILKGMKRTPFSDEKLLKLAELENDGVDIDSMTLRELAEKLGIKHPQTAKNILKKYRVLGLDYKIMIRFFK